MLLTIYILVNLFLLTTIVSGLQCCRYIASVKLSSTVPISFNKVTTRLNRVESKREHTSPLRMSLNDPPMELCEENLEIVVEEMKMALGTLFGYDEASRKVST